VTDTLTLPGKHIQQRHLSYQLKLFLHWADLPLADLRVSADQKLVLTYNEPLLTCYCLLLSLK